MPELRSTAIHGYADRLSVAPEESIEFKVSCEEPGTYRADVVRLIHGDTNPAGPGFKEEQLETEASGDYEGRFQATDAGSCVVVEDAGALALSGPFTLHAFVMPTTPGKEGQAIMGRYATELGDGLRADDRGRRADACPRRRRHVREALAEGAFLPRLLVLGGGDLQPRVRTRDAVLEVGRQLRQQPALADRARSAARDSYAARSILRPATRARRSRSPAWPVRPGAPGSIRISTARSTAPRSGVVFCRARNSMRWRPGSDRRRSGCSPHGILPTASRPRGFPATTSPTAARTG